jgi:mRNA-degrading endonuclease YafQ of YafQ-DinJ toxin-antitoxin module
MLKIKMQKQFIDRGIKLEKQEEIIENKDDIILSLQEDNSHLQAVLEKHRINGMELQEENEQLKIEMEKLRKIEQELIDR